MSWCVNRWHGATIGRHSLSQPLRAASSLREGAGNGALSLAPSLREPGGAAPFNPPLRNRKVAGDFHRPYETQKPFPFPIQPAARKPQGCGRFSSPLRNSNDGSLSRSSYRPETARLRAIFIAPTKAQKSFPFPMQPTQCVTEKILYEWGIM